MNYIESTKQLLNKMIEAKVANPKKIKGCTQEEIEKLENHYGFSLPKSYKAFLIVMGNNCGELHAGTDVLYHELFKDLENEDPVSFLKESLHDFNVDIPEGNIFVFSIHGAYQYSFFFVDGNQDPFGFVFIDEKDGAIRGGRVTFYQYLEYEVNRTIEFHKKRNNL